MGVSSSDLSPDALAARMRHEWDRRISHDYRYWMADGVRDDAAMWAVGERDFKIIFGSKDAQWAKNATALEIGCGVGRLLRPASAAFKRIIGADVSTEAIALA
ncbi:MAG: hypothetical protein IT290_00180, partial [Deltaproteobacteria bacterium]|nr:hypothetical protein [Deltaproteobacteria bacterium]